MTASASWPVNVDDPAALPPPEALRDLTLDELVDVLGSTRPLPQAVIDVLRKRANQSPRPESILDPLQRFNNETYLLRRTKRVALALDRLRQRLERPVLTREALDWRLHGPIGPESLARAFVKEATQPGEAVFLLAELALSLKRVNAGRAAEGGLDKTVINQALQNSIGSLHAQADAQISSNVAPEMARYVYAAFSEALK